MIENKIKSIMDYIYFTDPFPEIGFQDLIHNHNPSSPHHP